MQDGIPSTICFLKALLLFVSPPTFFFLFSDPTKQKEKSYNNQNAFTHVAEYERNAS